MFPMAGYLGHVDFGYDQTDQLFFLNDPTQLDRFIVDSGNVQNEEGNGNRTIADAQAAMERRSANARAPWNDIARANAGTRSRPR